LFLSQLETKNTLELWRNKTVKLITELSSWRKNRRVPMAQSHSLQKRLRRTSPLKVISTRELRRWRWWPVTRDVLVNPPVEFSE